MAEEDIGDLGINVTADLGGFGEDVVGRAAVTGEEAGNILGDMLSEAFAESLQGGIAPGLDEIKAKVGELAADISNNPAYDLDLNVNADTIAAEFHLEDFLREASGKLIEAKVHLEDETARAELIALTRDRVIKVITQTTGNAASGVGQVLGTAAPVFAVTEGISALLPMIGNASQFLLGIAGNLEQIVPFAALLPGILASGGVALGVFALDIKGLIPQLAILKSQAKELGANIESAFNARAVGPIKSAFTDLLPQITSVGNAISGSLGGAVATFARSTQSLLGHGGLSTLFSQLAPSITIASGAIRPLESAFVTLVSYAQQYLPTLAGMIVTIADDFQRWVQGIVASGQLGRFIQTAVYQLQQLESIGKSAFGIIQSIIGAAQTAGTGGLTTLANVLSTIEKVVQSPAFQTGLVGFFRASQAAVSSMMPALTAFGGFLSSLAGPLNQIMRLAGQTVGGVLTQLFKALSQKDVGQGLVAAITGISKAFTVLAPGLPGLATLFGALLKLFGAAAPIVGILARDIASLAPIVTSVASAITPLVSAIVGFIAAIPPGVLVAIVKGILAVVGAFEALTVIMAIVDGIMAISPFGLIVIGIVALIAAIVLLVTHWSQVVAFLRGLWTGFVSWLMGITNGLASWWRGVWGGITSFFRGLWTGLLGGVRAAWTGVMAFFASIPSRILAFFAAIPGLLRGVGHAMIQGFEWAVAAGLVVLYQIFIGIPMRIAAFFVAAPTWLVVHGTQLIMGLYNGVVSAFATVVAWFVALPGRILAFFAAALTWIETSGRNIITGMWNGLVAAFLTVTAWFLSLPGRIMGFFAAAASWLVSAGLNTLHGLESGAISGFAAVAGFLASIPGRITGFFAGAAGWLVGVGRSILEGLVSGIRSAIGGVESAIGNVVGGITSKFKSLLNINSPSKVIRDQIGSAIGEGLAAGIDQSTDTVLKSVGGITSAITGGLNKNLAISANLSGTGYGAGYSAMSGYASYTGAAAAAAGGINLGGVTISGVSSPQRAAQELVDRIAMRVGL